MAIRADQRTKQREFQDGEGGGGKLIIYGRPTLMWDGAPTPEDYYKSTFGYTEVHSIDVSAYEGATFVHDLNAPDLPPELVGQYDAVSMGGSAEHVFNVGNALRKAAELLRVGGTVICSGPANNWLDHGFYQLCPTLKFDFFQQNGFELGISLATLHLPGKDKFRRVIPIYPGEAQALNFIPARISHTLRAVKLENSTSHQIPLQTIYRAKHAGEEIKWRFRAAAPYDLRDGVHSNPPGPRVKLDPKRMKNPEKDSCFAHPYRFDGLLPSMPGRAFRSRALVFENDKLLPWIVSEKGMVNEKPGSFHHAGAFIFFSSSDGTDPRENGREYEVYYPDAFRGMEPYSAG